MPLSGLPSPPGVQPHGADLFLCDISLILSLLQELLEKGCSPSMIKVYVAAIDNYFGTSSFGARPRVECTLPCQGIENLY